MLIILTILKFKDCEVKMQQKIKYKFLIAAALFGVMASHPPHLAQADSCPDVKFVFVRGSGEERWTNPNYLEFKSKIEEKIKTTSLSYDFVDLDYPAIEVGFNNIFATIGAFFSGGEAYTFGDSVRAGINNLTNLINNSCPNTKYVLGGYSQGAMTISKALSALNANKIIYAATFGDPKLYLPEGWGLFPAACRGENLSEYRMYVPDCQAHKGLLGGNIPYRPERFIGKVGTWCNKRDIFCSSKFNIHDHVSYVSDELYTDASKVIFDKICKAFGIDNRITSLHDTVIMLDSTGSMGSMIEKYKDEAIRLATETLNSGGRVALYDYRDLDDPYTPVEHCNFETCTLELFEEKINSIYADGGGDDDESLLSAALHAMKSLKWKFGATKSMVVLTDAPFLMPDRDGVTREEVVRLSKEIDPVNFYIITEPELEDDYKELAEETDGMVFTDFGKLHLLTDYIMDRYDSLPKVEEGEPESLPSLEIKEINNNYNEVSIHFKSSSGRALVILNEAVLGVVEGEEVAISDIRGVQNTVTLVPITDTLRGDGVDVFIGGTIGAPNTGRQ